VALTAGWRELGVPFGFVARVALAGLVAAVPVMLLGPPPLVMTVVGTAVYAGALLVLGALPEGLRQDLLAGRPSSRGEAAP
jgi:hypothetical protein